MKTDIDVPSPGATLPLIEVEVDLITRNLLYGHALGARRNVMVEF